MTQVRISETPRPQEEEHPHSTSQDATSKISGNNANRARSTRSTRSTSSMTRSSTDGITADDGIRNIRSRLVQPSGRRSDTTMELGDDDPGLRMPGDFKQKQVFTGRRLLWLSYQSIGVIYGDIGTSPLYVYSSTFTSAPSRRDVIGVLSLIIWSLCMMVTVKYVFIILHADNDGEGGTFSTYSLLSRYMNITNRDPREASLIEIKRHLSGDLKATTRTARQRLESSKCARAILKAVGVLAVTMVISDGLLTPAQSVLGAVQGIKVVDPDINKSTVIGVTNAILIILFCVQPLGISKLTYAFSPIVIIWLGFNAAFGIYNLVKFDAGVFEAFNPGCGVEFLIHHGEHGWKMLGGVLLSFTGVEALFADLGAFSRRAVQLSWLLYAFPCLLLAYAGQASYISVHPDAYSNPFFNAAPPGTVYPALVIAILAAIVASQAIITATFQLLVQIMKLSYFPQIKAIHTSSIFHGQLYVPAANWLLMIGTILVASIYNNTTSLGNAYGVCVMFVTFFDTCVVSLVAIFVWRVSPFIVFLPWLIISCLDGAYLSSVLTKVPDGAWFTLVLSAVLAFLFLLWRFGKEQQWLAESQDRYPTSHFVKITTSGLGNSQAQTQQQQQPPSQIQVHLTDRFGSAPVSITRGLGIFFDKAGETTPIVFSQFVLKLTAMPEVTVFFHLRPLEKPSVALDERYTVSRLAIPHCYRLVVRYGYNDEIITPDLASVIVEQIKWYLVQQGREGRLTAPSQLPVVTPTESNEKAPKNTPSTASASLSKPSSTIHATTEPKQQQQLGVDAINEALTKVESAHAHKVLYIIGKEQMKLRPKTNYVRWTLLQIFLWIRENTRTKMANLKVPTDKVIEVGFLKDI
ncbi:potassium uptake protein [Paracoccidioides brasiliensis]|nr:potassium uptake protein [Paracoccidioides brasiliensis]